MAGSCGRCSNPRNGSWTARRRKRTAGSRWWCGCGLAAAALDGVLHPLEDLGRHLLGADLHRTQHGRIDRSLAQVLQAQGLAADLLDHATVLTLQQLGDRFTGNADGLVELDPGGPGNADVDRGDAGVQVHLGFRRRSCQSGTRGQQQRQGQQGGHQQGAQATQQGQGLGDRVHPCCCIRPPAAPPPPQP
jgi:hypothetical protein